MTKDPYLSKLYEVARKRRAKGEPLEVDKARRLLHCRWCGNYIALETVQHRISEAVGHRGPQDTTYGRYRGCPVYLQAKGR